MSPEPKKEKTEEQRQRNKKRIVLPIIFILFGVAMWLIFKPSAKDEQEKEQQQGYNTDVPSADQ